MKKIVLFSLLALISCSKKVEIASISKLNGYWQIQKVEDANGNKKDYPINEVYDYFEVKNNSGFHKKVTWQPDGTYLINDLQDEVKIIVKNDKVIVDFKSKFGNHIEELVAISENELVLKSKEEVSFYYTKVNQDKKE
jgi:hypothetical protein